MPKAHVAEYKKKVVAEFVKFIKEYPIVGVLNVENLPAPQFQKMREQLRDKVEIRMSKRRLITIAIDKCKEDKKGIEGLTQYLGGMPALIFSKQNPFKLTAILQKSKSKAPAKAGQIAPEDIIIKAGPTPFAPGPVIGELAAIGLKASVVDGKVAIMEDKVVTPKDGEITPETAALLSRLSIKPMEVGLDFVAGYDDGVIYEKDVLAIDEAVYLNNLKSSVNDTFNLAMFIGYTTSETIKPLIQKAYNDTKALALSQEIMSDVVVSDMVGKAEMAAVGLAKKAKIDLTAPKEEVKEAPTEEKAVEEPKQETAPTQVKSDASEVKKEPTEDVPKEEPITEEKTEVVKETPKEPVEAPKEDVPKEEITKVEEMVKQLKQRAQVPKPSESVPSVAELVENAQKHSEKEKQPSTSDLLSETEEKPEKKNNVPTAHELAQRKK